MNTIINDRIIQPKSRDESTDRILSDVFRNLLNHIVTKHGQLVDLAEMLNIPVKDNEKFYSWYTH